MNRLPMFYKFSLISVLFLLPIIALSWLVISELNRSVDTMTRGVEGLEQLEKVDTLLAESMAYRDFRAPGKIKDDNELLSKSAESSETIDRLLEELVSAEARFDESGNWSQQVAMLVEEWQTLKSMDSYQGNIDPQFHLHSNPQQQRMQGTHKMASATHAKVYAPATLKIMDQRIDRGRGKRVAPHQQRMDRKRLPQQRVF